MSENDRTLERVRAAYAARRALPKAGWYRCTNCGNVETFEREVWCWRCGKGEMVYVER
jgi:uncharacterized OB-fold protein